MNIVMTIDGVTTPMKIDSLCNVIPIERMEYTNDVASQMEAIAVSKSIGLATAQIYALAQGRNGQKTIFYIFEEQSSNPLKIIADNAMISGWAISYEKDRGSEYFTVESNTISFPSSSK